MRIGFFGSPPPAADLLRALADPASGHEVRFVVSNPDRPRGRSGRAQLTAVSALAEELGLPLYRFKSLKAPEVAAQLAAHEADLYLVFAYGRLLPAAVFEAPPARTMNLHASLLPELRGASPVESAILRGLNRTGWTLQYIVQELDAGDIVATREIDILPGERAGELLARMVPGGIDLVVETLARPLPKGRPQAAEGATFCSLLKPEMSLMDWKRSAAELHNFARAFHPRPVARTVMQDGKGLKLLRTGLVDAEAENGLPTPVPGQVVVLKSQGRLLVGTGAGFLELLELQPESKKALKARDFLNGATLSSGDRFGET